MEGRYPKTIMAAVCVAAFCSVAVTGAFAHHRPGHNPPGHSKQGHGSYERDHGGPPAWAPAWGYRGKRTIRYERAGRMYEAGPEDLVRVPDIGLGQCNRDTIGAILGGAIGAAAGSQFGKGDGRAMDQVDQNCIGQALERAPDGKTVIWNNPDRRGEYRVTPTRTWQTPGGTYCREFQTKIVIDGRLQDAYGTACRQPDGTWRRV